MRNYLFLFGLILLASVNGFADKEDFKFKQVPDYYRYKEQFVGLFDQWLYSDQDNISRNISFLEYAYCVPFDNPIKALVPVTNENQYRKYQNLLMMHICRLLTQAYIDYGYYFFQEHIQFYNHEYLKLYLDGYEIAEFYFGEARKYWNLAIGYAQQADAVKGYHLNFDIYGYHFDLEDEMYKMKTGMLDYYKVIDNLMMRLDKNRKQAEGLLNAYK
ncbi:MAG: hypothetical protein HPY53_10420 [Brevinematales bacterium]|nr:hypothetical protein [Brevinematales bacterium]